MRGTGAGRVSAYQPVVQTNVASPPGESLRPTSGSQRRQPTDQTRLIFGAVALGADVLVRRAGGAARRIDEIAVAVIDKGGDDRAGLVGQSAGGVLSVRVKQSAPGSLLTRPAHLPSVRGACRPNTGRSWTFSQPHLQNPFARGQVEHRERTKGTTPDAISAASCFPSA